MAAIRSPTSPVNVIEQKTLPSSQDGCPNAMRSDRRNDMNPILEQKVRDLMDEAERQGAPAMHTVLHLLYASYLEGNQNEFARHCCRLTPVESIRASVTEREDNQDSHNREDCEDWPAELDPRGYVN